MASGKKVLRWLAGSVVVVGAILWVEARHLGLTTASAQLEEQLRLAKQEGLPLTPADLNLKPISEDDNAFTPIMNAFSQIKILPTDPTLILDKWQSTYGKVIPTDAQAEAALADLKPAMDTAERASKRPYLDMHSQWDRASDLDFVADHPCRILAKCFIAKARLLRIKHKPEGAVQALKAAARLGALLSSSPTSVPLFTRVAIESLLFREASNFLRSDSSDGVVRGVTDVAATMGAAPNVKASMQGDFLWLRSGILEMGYMKDVTGTLYDDDIYPAEWKLMRLSSISDLNQANAIEFFRRQYMAVPNGESSLAGLPAKVQNVDNDVDMAGGLGYMASSRFLPSRHQLVESWMECLARRRVCAAGLDILAQRNRTGKFPATWSKPGVDGIDPFTDKPLIYRRKGAGFVVYSVDKDGKDDGGRPYPLDNDVEHRQDISFEYPTLSVRPVPPPTPAPTVPGGLPGGD